MTRNNGSRGLHIIFGHAKTALEIVAPNVTFLTVGTKTHVQYNIFTTVILSNVLSFVA